MLLEGCLMPCNLRPNFFVLLFKKLQIPLLLLTRFYISKLSTLYVAYLNFLLSPPFSFYYIFWWIYGFQDAPQHVLNDLESLLLRSSQVVGPICSIVSFTSIVLVLRLFQLVETVLNRDAGCYLLFYYLSFLKGGKRSALLCYQMGDLVVWHAALPKPIYLYAWSCWS